MADDADAATLKSATEELQQASQLLGQKIYEASAAQQADTADASDADSGEGEEEVVEAEIIDEGEGDGN